jgi:hypothetical protein
VDKGTKDILLWGGAAVLIWYLFFNKNTATASTASGQPMITGPNQNPNIGQCCLPAPSSCSISACILNTPINFNL